MRQQPPKHSVFLFIFSITMIVFLLFYNFDKSHSLLIDRILDFGHVPLFSVVTALILWTLDWKNWPKATTKNYIQAGIIASVLAIMTEVLQQLTPERSFQVGDILSDLIGAGVFLAIAYQYRRVLQGGIRVFLCTAAAVLLLIACLPVFVTVSDELRSRRDFPLLGSFETRGEMYRWKSEECTLEQVPLHPIDGDKSLRVLIPPGLYPGITMDYPPRDWRGYDTLTFHVFLEGIDPLPLTIRINDLAHNEEYEDRYNRTFTLQPGPNQLSISLSEVEHAPKGRLMDMEHISILCIFSYKLKEQRTVYFDNFRLEKDG